jgi:glycosyltransferase involved in cell wall biosynthesis
VGGTIDDEGWTSLGDAPGLIALSHLRWGSVHQRPHHLMAQAARTRAVFYVEEPWFDAEHPALEQIPAPEGPTVFVPHLPVRMSEDEADATLALMIEGLADRLAGTGYVLWFETPMFAAHTRALRPLASVYDCMDELSGFAGAPASLSEREVELLASVDVVFTGGRALFERKRGLHRSVHAFPSSVDADHFRRARGAVREPRAQAGIPHPRLGFSGVVDERMDLSLLDGIAAARPEWHLVIVGPILKIDASRVPDRPNIHYLGERPYADLPAFLSGWDAGLIPFARNGATRYISPTKTLEYLAAGVPVVSTSIPDVVAPYGVEGFARIADSPADFVSATEHALAEDRGDFGRRADAILRRTSWERTWAEMEQFVDEAIERRAATVMAGHA